jgi:acyl-[acyl-carrier-protein]-phospholipid O-acyltransferase/long-chain-fatty-acid--[acyl-carrier-protein] ligase
VAQPGLKFHWPDLVMNKDTWDMLRADKLLVEVLLISSLFWFLGGVMQPASNTFGKRQLGLDDGTTSLLQAFLAIGIAAGCVLAGKLSHHEINFGLVRIGSWGLIGSLLFLMLLGVSHAAGISSDDGEGLPFGILHNLCRLGMLGVGFFGGLFIVPLQVFMQARPPEDQKGRMIGAMNLVNWLAICLAAGFYIVSAVLLNRMKLEIHWIFGVMACIILPVAIFYHPPDESLSAN